MVLLCGFGLVMLGEVRPGTVGYYEVVSGGVVTGEVMLGSVGDGEVGYGYIRN